MKVKDPSAGFDLMPPRLVLTPEYIRERKFYQIGTVVAIGKFRSAVL